MLLWRFTVTERRQQRRGNRWQDRLHVWAARLAAGAGRRSPRWAILAANLGRLESRRGVSGMTQRTSPPSEETRRIAPRKPTSAHDQRRAVRGPIAVQFCPDLLATIRAEKTVRRPPMRSYKVSQNRHAGAWSRLRINREASCKTVSRNDDQRGVGPSHRETMSR